MEVGLKLQNPQLEMIPSYIKNWRVTMAYHETKDLIHVQGLLGRKKIDSTMFYVNLESAIFQTENDNYHVKAAKSQKKSPIS